MKRSDLKNLIKECYKEILSEEYTPDYSEYSNDALTDMIINLSRYEGNEDIIGMVKDELKKRKEQSKTIQEKMKQSELKALIKECYREVLNEEANTDLELKSAAKNIFSVLKKYGLKPTYEADGKQFMSKDPGQSGYGARIHINNGIMTVAVYDRGIWQTIQRKQTNELDMGAVSNPSDQEKKQINQIAGKIYNDIVSTLGNDKFEVKTGGSGVDEYGNYLIYIRKKQSDLKENEEMDLPADTGKNINMGFDNNVGLDVDKRMSGNMSKVMSQIEMLKNKLAPFIADFKSKKLSKEEYMAATKGLVADLKKAQMALELMMAKL